MFTPSSNTITNVHTQLKTQLLLCTSSFDTATQSPMSTVYYTPSSGTMTNVHTELRHNYQCTHRALTQLPISTQSSNPITNAHTDLRHNYQRTHRAPSLLPMYTPSSDTTTNVLSKLQHNVHDSTPSSKTINNVNTKLPKNYQCSDQARTVRDVSLSFFLSFFIKYQFYGNIVMGAQYNKGFRVRLNTKPPFSSACLPTISITHKSTLDPHILGRCDTDPLGPGF